LCDSSNNSNSSRIPTYLQFVSPWRVMGLAPLAWHVSLRYRSLRSRHLPPHHATAWRDAAI